MLNYFFKKNLVELMELKSGDMFFYRKFLGKVKESEGIREETIERTKP